MSYLYRKFREITIEQADKLVRNESENFKRELSEASQTLQNKLIERGLDPELLIQETQRLRKQTRREKKSS